MRCRRRKICQIAFHFRSSAVAAVANGNSFFIHFKIESPLLAVPPTLTCMKQLVNKFISNHFVNIIVVDEENMMVFLHFLYWSMNIAKFRCRAEK